ncbi:MFS transporter [Demequina flava]|uniref:MFS transporter n=1 Tax=Demequina flava TaxID=1095025 RepID=UPI0007867E42|nr:MFS transporter [Demequina flava]
MNDVPRTLELDMRPYLESDATRTMEIIERIDAEEAEAAAHSAEQSSEPGQSDGETTDGIPTVEAHATDDTADAEPTHDSYYAEHYEHQPTTMSIPVIGGAAAVVLEEEEPGSRSEASLLVSARRAKLGLLTLAVGAFAMGVNEATIVALSTDIAAGLGVSVSAVGLLATAFALTVVLSAIPLTFLTKRWSRRVSITAAMSVWSVGLVIAATSTTMGQLAAGRVTSGVAHALFWALVAPTAASLFAPHLRPKTVTGIMLGAAAAGVIGTPLVTAAGANLSWRVPYFALAVLGIALAVAVAMVLPSSRGVTSTSHTLGDLPSRNDFFRVLAVTFLAAMGMSATWTYIVPFFTEVSGLDTDMLPLMFAFGGLLAVAATMAVSRYIVRHAVRTVAIGAAMVALAWAILWTGGGWAAVIAQGLQAAGWAVLVAALLNWAMRHTPWRTEVGGGIYTTTANAGAAAGPVVGAGIVGTWGTQALPAVSFFIFMIALLITVTVDKRTRSLLNVPRHVRAAQASVAELNARRSAWRQREKELGIQRRKGGKPKSGKVRTRSVPGDRSERLQSMESVGYGITTRMR